jgi:hypothetical protein
MFLVGVCALTILVSGLLLSLVVVIFPIVRRLQSWKEAIGQKESFGSFAQWSVGSFGKLTAIQTIWSIAAYAVFFLLNLQQDKGRLLSSEQTLFALSQLSRKACAE